MIADPQPAQGSTADFCERWPDDGHTMKSHKPARSPIWVGVCSSCGWIDGDNLAEQVRERLATAEAERDAMRPVVEAVGDLLDAGHALDEADAEDDDWKGAEQERDRAWSAMVDAHNAALNQLAATSPSSATQDDEQAQEGGPGTAKLDNVWVGVRAPDVELHINNRTYHIKDLPPDDIEALAAALGKRRRDTLIAEGRRQAKAELDRETGAAPCA